MRRFSRNPLEFCSFDNFDGYRDLTAVTTTRAGGTSAGDFASLNLGLDTGDDAGAVLDNRTRLSLITGAAPDLLTFASQVHGSRVAVVNHRNLASESAIPGADALITNLPDVPLVILVADCAVVFFYDPVKKAAGIAHAGWRGTAERIASKTVTKMAETFGTVPAEVRAAIGPAIGPCCYEIGQEVYQRFCSSNPEAAKVCFIHPSASAAGTGAKKHLDLWRANRLDLEAAGLDANNIDVAAVCTACNTDKFFSHRAEKGSTGRFAGLIMIHGRTKRAY